MNYNNSKIYKLCCGELTYYGSTTQSLHKRKYGHKMKYLEYKKGLRRYTTSFLLFQLDEENDFENVNIILVEECPCNSKYELHQRERYYIENNECVNKVIPTRTDREYRQDNIEKEREYRKKYKEKNKERIKEKRKEYYERNKDRIKNYRDANREKHREYMKEYMRKNRERIREYKKKYREQKKQQSGDD